MEKMMALTKTTITWSDNTPADVTIDGITVTNVMSPYIVDLLVGEHTCRIVENGVTIFDDTLHVPKALADKVDEEITNRNLVTRSELQTQIELAIEATQGFIDIVRIQDESSYNVGANNDETITQWSLYYKIVQPAGAVPAVKVKTIDNYEHTNIVDVNADTVYSAIIVRDPVDANYPIINEIQVLAGNNRVIDKLDLTMLVLETDEPNVLYDKSSIEKIIVRGEAAFKIKPLKTEFKSYKINRRVGQLGSGSITEITSDIATNGILMHPNTDNNIEFYDEAGRLLYKYYIDEDIKIVGTTNDGTNFHITGVSGNTPVYTVYADGSTRQNTWGVNDDYTIQPIESGSDYVCTLNSVATGKDDGKIFYYSLAGVQ
jgi:phage terminase large subunit-like protein